MVREQPGFTPWPQAIHGNRDVTRVVAAVIRLVPAVVRGHDHREVAVAERLRGECDEPAQRTAASSTARPYSAVIQPAR